MIVHVERQGISLRHQLVVDVLDYRYDPTMLRLGVMAMGLARFVVVGMALMSSAADARLTKQAKSKAESAVEGFMRAPCRLINRLMKIWLIVVLGCATDGGASFRLVRTGFCFALQRRVDHLEAVGQHRL